MNVLLYGGCHALVLRNYLEGACPGEVACTLIVNFELIRSGAPFPYDALGGFDAVVYSPIENKGAYNTAHLDDACRRLGIPAIRYPWLEWHGYCPGAAKGAFAGRVQWFYPALAAAAEDEPVEMNLVRRRGARALVLPRPRRRGGRLRRQLRGVLRGGDRRLPR